MARSSAIAREYSQRFALTVTEWRVMAVLGRYPGLAANKVAERTAMDKVAVSRAVSSLVAEGRLTRKVDGDDRRRARLRLSAKGYRIYDKVAPLALAYQQRLLAALSADERALLEALLSVGVPHERAVSAGHLLVASMPIFEPSPATGPAKSR